MEKSAGDPTGAARPAGGFAPHRRTYGGLRRGPGSDPRLFCGLPVELIKHKISIHNFADPEKYISEKEGMLQEKKKLKKEAEKKKEEKKEKAGKKDNIDDKVKEDVSEEEKKKTEKKEIDKLLTQKV